MPINQYLEMTGDEPSGATRGPMDERAEGSEGSLSAT